MWRRACDRRVEGGKGRGREGQAEVDGWAGGVEGLWREVQVRVEERAGGGVEGLEG